MRIHEENTGVLSQNGSLSGMFANSKMSGAGFIPESSLGSLPTDPKTGRQLHLVIGSDHSKKRIKQD